MKKGEDFIGVSIVYLCTDGKGSFLLNKRSANCRDEHNRWDCGGGALEFGDSVEETLKKEIMEEYTTDVITYEFLGYRDIHRIHNSKETHWISLDFKALVDRSKVSNGEPHKFDEIGWYRLNEFPNPLHSQFPEFLRKYSDKL
jgi:8-oxo-dGTP pyrophosphatase MutT (NUDIX family)